MSDQWRDEIEIWTESQFSQDDEKISTIKVQALDQINVVLHLYLSQVNTASALYCHSALDVFDHLSWTDWWNNLGSKHHFRVGVQSALFFTSRGLRSLDIAERVCGGIRRCGRFWGRMGEIIRILSSIAVLYIYIGPATRAAQKSGKQSCSYIEDQPEEGRKKKEKSKTVRKIGIL